MAEIIPTDRELDVLKVLWQRGDSTVRETCDALNEEGVDLAYTTVLSFMQIMERKGLVKHRKGGKAYKYYTKLERDTTFRTLARGFLDRVFDGAVDEYVYHVLDSQDLSTEELDRLEELIVARKSHSKRKTKKKGRR